MEEKKGNNIVVILIVIIALCLIAGAVGWYLGGKVEKLTPKPSNTSTNVTPSETSDNQNTIVYKQVSVNGLQNKLSQLDFSPKLSSEVIEADSTFKVEVTNGVALLTYHNVESDNSFDKTYTVDSVTDVISAGIGFSVEGSGFAETYLLTSSGKVYKIDDALKKDGEFGKVTELNVNNAISIAVVDNNFNLLEDAATTSPTVYIKTADSKVLTDESGLIDIDNPIVEVIDK